MTAAGAAAFPVTLDVPATPTGPALRLRPWRPSDVAALVEACKDPELRRWTSHSSIGDDEDGLRWIRSQRQSWEAGDRFCFAVIEAQPGCEQGELMGQVVLKDVAPGKASAEVGYWTAARARGRGVAPRALEALTNWAFAPSGSPGAGGLRRLELLHQEDNLASCRVAHKSGYALDRVLPASPPEFPRDGHVHVRRKGEGIA
ncbi:GNAT family N-acetyltransferase [Streptomyces sp. ME02-8801-2C]|uniref:GNAT family N-acetyltransferase n=1 Tax=Streptomyces sp. ME02-8801-2C TaxID=3028680 RepID=UPI0029B7E79B|nr:GNAT family N-acetyltransferase [Streptomyces sp. ME02-8801-2C]MDX3453977.1 GNAT family N-acetyltransferase [Streptomyces sp. ME02-8801-2C]